MFAGGGRINRTSQAQAPAEPQDNNLKVQIDYTDTTGKRHTIEKSVPIQFRSIDSTDQASSQTLTFRSRTNAWSEYLLYIIIAIAVVAGLVCYKKRRFLRKRLRRRPAKSKE
jgi:hypothetical protein